MALSKIPSAGFQDNVKFRNILINGSLDISQRSTSTSSITSTGYHTVDRWQTNISSMGTWTQSQSTTVPSGQGFAKSLKMDCTTADASPSAGDQVVIEQKVEGQNLQYLNFGNSSAKSLTLSFWVRSNKTGTYCASLFNNDQSKWFSKQYTISSADTWEKKTLTYAGDTSNAFNNDNGTSLRCRFWLGAGSTYTSGTITSTWTTESGNESSLASGQVNLADSTSNEWYITGVQLEAGTTASDFEFLPVDVNTARCHRYFVRQQRYASAVCDKWTTNKLYAPLNLPQPLRGLPTVKKSDGSTSDIVIATNNNNRDSNADIHVIYGNDTDSSTGYNNFEQSKVTIVFNTSFDPNSSYAMNAIFNRELYIDAEL
jgi:hypothetical protein